MPTLPYPALTAEDVRREMVFVEHPPSANSPKPRTGGMEIAFDTIYGQRFSGITIADLTSMSPNQVGGRFPDADPPLLSTGIMVRMTVSVSSARLSICLPLLISNSRSQGAPQSKL